MACEHCGNDINVTRKLFTDFYLCPACWAYYSTLRNVVCLCGSTRFYDDFARINLRETLTGSIVLSIGCDTHHVDSDYTIEQKRALDRLHMAKIRMANEIIVINKDGYIGESTAREIAMAEKLGKTIRYEYDH